MIGDDHSKLVFFSDTFSIFAKASGKSLEQYRRDCDVTTKLHRIKKPFFFISAIDDPFFGRKVIPIGHCHDNILLGVLKHGGHCCNIEGGILPTGQWWTKPSMVFMDHFMREAVKSSEQQSECQLTYINKSQGLLLSPRRGQSSHRRSEDASESK
jgi:hypothetical protein